MNVVDHQLVDAVSFSTYPCTTRGPASFTLADVLALGYVYQWLLAGVFLQYQLICILC